ncbi:UDP-glucose 4-epimerase GalE [Metabacillus sp. cB07]|uniref:UDP-glucose 4-epimerase GalE n=1 Tax=Metabacillus sp. cB07 TaxID=2806989 RepID=UPI001939BA02|nr:UDP-glucose 4-epimerase GalE [Metabacillus sp. cB07]
MNILITGGAGYIGSHTCIELLSSGHHIIVVDDLSNSNEMSLERVKELTGRDFIFEKIDIADKKKLEKIFMEQRIDAVIHFAGLKAVGESVAVPLRYYHNNITGSLVLFNLMEKYGVRNLVFSSSATVYGANNQMPLTEEMTLSATNPYGKTKLYIEEILRDLSAANSNWSIALLRYFNPVGAHSSGLIGEDPSGIPNNLIPYVTQVAIGKREYLSVFGSDYETKDGTGVRDYIHVVDLAKGHLKALEEVTRSKGIGAYNLGTGKGYSVLDIVRVFEKIIGRKIPYQLAERRPGDLAVSYADCSKAQIKLNWAAKKDLEEMCRDSWNWQVKNPEGYINQKVGIN